MYQLYGKRLLDLVLSTVIIAIAAPALLLAAILVRINLGSPVFYRQRRPGLNGEIFTIYKFRTMSGERDGSGNLLPDKQRLTTLGRILRKTSVDELPELFNVLKGDMSLIGPRPLLTRYLPRYTETQFRRHEVLPGLTGWAQIHGRTALDWETRFRYDVWYVDNYGFWLDLRILLLTVRLIFAGDGVDKAPGGVWTEFWGTHGPPSKGELVFPSEGVEHITKKQKTQA